MDELSAGNTPRARARAGRGRLQPPDGFGPGRVPTASRCRRPAGGRRGPPNPSIRSVSASGSTSRPSRRRAPASWRRPATYCTGPPSFPRAPTPWSACRATPRAPSPGSRWPTARTRRSPRSATTGRRASSTSSSPTTSGTGSGQGGSTTTPASTWTVIGAVQAPTSGLLSNLSFGRARRAGRPTDSLRSGGTGHRQPCTAFPVCDAYSYPPVYYWHRRSRHRRWPAGLHLHPGRLPDRGDDEYGWAHVRLGSPAARRLSSRAGCCPASALPPTLCRCT